jgi:sterol desaturase/sphingolipid hydroxylase (fatty acid hydroxylase superfamily)
MNIIVFGILMLVLIVFYVGFILLEHKYPLRHQKNSLKTRLLPNLTLTLISGLISAILFGPMVYFSILAVKKYDLGLLNLVGLKGVPYYIVGFLMMDLIMYYWHRLNHQLSFLWRFHNIHHIDLDLDTTTSLRFHIVETLYTGVYRLFQIILVGTNVPLFVAYEMVFQINTFFQHSNIKLPISFERLLNIILVTPRMHGIHHSNYKDENYSNWGIVFSFWDKMHKTLKLNVPQQQIVIGVPAYGATDNVMGRLMKIPFESQRLYWVLDNKPHYTRNYQDAPLEE